jgi:universal stress protein A
MPERPRPKIFRYGTSVACRVIVSPERGLNYDPAAVFIGLSIMKVTATPQQRRRPMPIKRIVCCTDFSENAEAAFSAALEMAEKYAADMTVIHVLPPPINPMLVDTGWIMPEEPRESLVQQIEEKMAQVYGKRMNGRVEYRLVVLDGHVSTELIKFLEENPIDVVVLGAYGLSGMGLVIFGSVAKRVAHKAPCSVMIVRSRN